MTTIDVELATLNLKTGEINLYNTDKLSLDQLAEFIDTLNTMKDSAYLMDEQEIEDMCAGGLLHFNVLLPIK